MKFIILMISVLVTTFLNSFEPHFMEDPAISPDGNSVCFSYLSDLWIVPFKGGEAKRLTSSEGIDFNPVFSPDGKFIVFNSNRDGWNCIYQIPAAGGIAESISGEGLKIIDFFPDGKSILTVGNEPDYRYKFFRLELDGSFYEITSFGGNYGAVSPDGKKLIFNHWGKPTREAYKGSGNGEIYEYDLENKDFGRLTKTEYTERYPVYSSLENSIYFAGSDRKVFQLFRVDSYDFSQPKQLTFFENWSVRDISIAWENDRIVFEKFAQIWKYDPSNQKVEKIEIEINEDCLPEFLKKEEISNKAKRFVISPDGKLVVFSYKYDLFAVPEKGDEVKQITKNQAGIKSVEIMDDNQTIFFSSFEDGEPKLFKTNITDISEIEKIKWSNDKKINHIYSSQNRLLINYSDKKRRNKVAMADSLGDNIQTIIDEQFVWQKAELSEDGRYVLYAELREQLWSNHLFVLDLQTKEKHQIYNYDGFIGNIFWGKDKKTAFFSRGKEICKINLVPLEDFSNEKDNWKPILNPTEKEQKPESEEIKISFENIENRVKPLISKPGYNRILHVLNDSLFYYLNTFEEKSEIRKTDYSAKDDKSIYTLSKNATHISYNEQNKCFYLLENQVLKKLHPKTKKIETIKFDFKYEYDKLDLNKDIFTQVWKKYGDEFYDPEMHGVDWKEVYQRFSKYSDFIYNTKILDDIIEEMMGEVNASHTGFTPRKEGTHKIYSKACGGFVLDFQDYPKEGIKFKKIYRNSKLDKPYNIKPEDVLLKVDGEEVGKGKPLTLHFMDKIGEKIELEILSGDSIKTVTIKGLKYWENSKLYYHDWVEQRKEIVNELSDGKIGYLHIRWMSDRSYEKFLHDFFADNYRKDALIIDVRNNSGGHTHDKILEVLTKRSYAQVSRRYFDLQKHKVPHEAWEKPLALLINENSFSDAEIFLAIFQEFELGKVIGMPTAGAVIGTNNYTLMDGSKMRLPQNGWYLLDGTNLEGTGAKPDIRIEPTPEQIIADDDIQLKRAVEELLQELE